MRRALSQCAAVGGRWSFIWLAHTRLVLGLPAAALQCQCSTLASPRSPHPAPHTPLLAPLTPHPAPADQTPADAPRTPRQNLHMPYVPLAWHHMLINPTPRFWHTQASKPACVSSRVRGEICCCHQCHIYAANWLSLVSAVCVQHLLAGH